MFDCRWYWFILMPWILWAVMQLFHILAKNSSNWGPALGWGGIVANMILTKSLTEHGVVMKYMQTLVPVLELAMFFPWVAFQERWFRIAYNSIGNFHFLCHSACLCLLCSKLAVNLCIIGGDFFNEPFFELHHYTSRWQQVSKTLLDEWVIELFTRVIC